ncbi:MAG: SAM-dependent methyltransferase [Lautropia sp.]
MSANPGAGGDARQRFLARLAAAIAQQTLTRLSLARPRPTAEAGLERLLVRPVALKDGLRFALTWRYATRDVTGNLTGDALLATVAELAGPVFASARCETASHVIELGFSKRDRPLLRVTAQRDGVALLPQREVAPLPQREVAPLPPVRDARPPVGDALPEAPPHNREKPRHLRLDRPFLAALGVTDAAGRLIPAMARKWRQIDKFIEVFDAAWRAAGSDAIGTPARPLAIVDYGAGKGYLTFALYDYLTASRGLTVRMTGVERRADLVEFCNRTAAALGLTGLRFRRGEIAAARAAGGDDGARGNADTGADADTGGNVGADADTGPAPVDVVIALHACDTATDDALAQGVAGGAAILIGSPCCHKELRPQLLAPGPLAPILRHGIHRAEAAEMLTDSLRALLLEASGFDAQVFEFVSLEHTAKNKMILATRRRQPDAALQARARREIDQLKSFYGIASQRLDRLLADQAGGS